MTLSFMSFHGFLGVSFFSNGMEVVGKGFLSGTRRQLFLFFFFFSFVFCFVLKSIFFHHRIESALSLSLSLSLSHVIDLFVF